MGITVQMHEVGRVGRLELHQPRAGAQHVLVGPRHPFQVERALDHADAVDRRRLGELLRRTRGPHYRQDHLGTPARQTTRQLQGVSPDAPNRVNGHEHAGWD
jgi:hypothetical protein